MEHWGGLPLIYRLADATGRCRIVATGEVVGTDLGRLGPARTYFCIFDDGTARVTLAFIGRRDVPGLTVGTRCRIVGTAQLVGGSLLVLNPEYEFAEPNFARLPE